MSTHTETPELTPQSIGVILASVAGTLFSASIMTTTAIAVFIAQIAADYGWSRAAIGGAVTALYAGTAISCPFFGRLVDRIGPRRVLLPLILIQGLVLSGFALIGKNLPLFYAAHFVLGLCSPGAVAYSKLISGWFFRRRAIALTGLAFGVYTAKVAAPPVVRHLMSSIGWRNVYVCFAGATLLLALPTLTAFFKEHKAAAGPGASPEVRPDGAPHIGALDAIHGRTFWFLLGAQFGGTFAQMGIAAHGAGIMIEHGVNSSLAAWGLSLMAFGGLSAQVMTGILLDRFDTPRVILPFAVVSLFAAIGLHLAHDQAYTLALLLLFGVACGGQTSMTSYFTTRYFGVRNFSGIYGSFVPLLWMSTSPAPIIVGAFYDRNGSYDSALLLVEAVLALAAIFFALLGAYPYPVKPAARVESSAEETQTVGELAAVLK